MEEMKALKPLILVVDDNPDVLLNLKVQLEFSGYKIIPVESGEKAIQFLEKSGNKPDLIISDIMMPEMDGYDFFNLVSNDKRWNLIPFLFLTAKASPDDIRFGKKLGIDDYITKPFNEEDLLAIISGKLKRSRQINLIHRKMETLMIHDEPSLVDNESESVILIFVTWDDKQGPVLKSQFPLSNEFPFSLEKVSFQLFQGGISIFGLYESYTAEGYLLNIKNIVKNGYIYFDSIQDASMRGEKTTFMLAALAPKINFFDSLEIRRLFQELSSKIQNYEEWQLENYWYQIVDILSTPFFEK